MNLRFETRLYPSHNTEVPVLVDAENIHVDRRVDGISIDGSTIEVDDDIPQRIADTVARINDEVLPRGHFRDCASFAMGMCGIWLPTRRLLEPSHTMKLICDDATNEDRLLGPVATGIPNDESCLGFRQVPYVYSHMAFGITTESNGPLYAYKSGINSEYFLAQRDLMLTVFEHQVIHPATQLQFTRPDGTSLVNWNKSIE